MGSIVIIGVVNSVVLIQALKKMNSEVLFANLYVSTRSVGEIVLLVCCLMLGNALLGFVGAYNRSRNVIKVFFLVLFLLLILNLCAIVMLDGMAVPDQLKVQETEFRQGWEGIVANVVEGEDPSGIYETFLSKISTVGKCCGYDSTTSELQNPEQLGCSQVATCKMYIDTFIQEEIASLVLSYLILLVLMAIDYIILVFFIVRIVPQPVHHEDPGGWYYV
mmetsp:Transcript_24002/g.42323  ORF Transcript_24002/g.42323 Transcript_24002/m.42323 type:complete len:220 (-) Transcript_24002:556-1215(-)